MKKLNKLRTTTTTTNETFVFQQGKGARLDRDQQISKLRLGVITYLLHLPRFNWRIFDQGSSKPYRLTFRVYTIALRSVAHAVKTILIV